MSFLVPILTVAGMGALAYARGSMAAVFPLFKWVGLPFLASVAVVIMFAGPRLLAQLIRDRVRISAHGIELERTNTADRNAKHVIRPLSAINEAAIRRPILPPFATLAGLGMRSAQVLSILGADESFELGLGLQASELAYIRNLIHRVGGRPPDD